MNDNFLVKNGNIGVSIENGDTYRTFYETHQPHFQGDFEHRNFQVSNSIGQNMSQHIPTPTEQNLNLINDITFNTFKK